MFIWENLPITIEKDHLEQIYKENIEEIYNDYLKEGNKFDRQTTQISQRLRDSLQ